MKRHNSTLDNESQPKTRQTSPNGSDGTHHMCVHQPKGDEYERRHEANGKSQWKRQKVNTEASPLLLTPLANNATVMMDEPEFSKLDPSNPVHARRIQQRRRIIAYGKNTVGYDRYLKQVPKEKRRARSMVTPATPDHTLDIPNKRFQGQVRAWRRALHQYDPPDLQNSFTAEVTMTEEIGETPSPAAQDMSVQDLELAQAQADGLLVETTPGRGGTNADPSLISPLSSETMHVTSSNDHDIIGTDIEELDSTIRTTNPGGNDFLLSDDDSDDDLL